VEVEPKASEPLGQETTLVSAEVSEPASWEPKPWEPEKDEISFGEQSEAKRMPKSRRRSRLLALASCGALAIGGHFALELLPTLESGPVAMDRTRARDDAVLSAPGFG